LDTANFFLKHIFSFAQYGIFLPIRAMTSLGIQIGIAGCWGTGLEGLWLVEVDGDND
jgi:hypothetical protein